MFDPGVQCICAVLPDVEQVSSEDLGDDVPNDDVPGHDVPNDEVPGDDVPGNDEPGDDVPSKAETQEVSWLEKTFSEVLDGEDVLCPHLNILLRPEVPR